jgi:hypothetical protein
MNRIRMFLKGNLDVYDSLHSCRINNTLCWNGINQIPELLDSKIKVQIKHETWTRSDALLASSGRPPSSILERTLPLGSFQPEAQFSQEIFSANVDAYILSIQPDIAIGLARHKTEGYLFHPAHFDKWDKNDADWFRDNFEPINHLTPSESINNFRLIIERLRQKSSAPIMIYNLSPIIPGEEIYCHMGLTDSLSARIQRFNLELINLSDQTGASIIDVNRILSSHGVNRLKLDAWHLNAEGSRLIAHEVVRILLETIPKQSKK